MEVEFSCLDGATIVCKVEPDGLTVGRTGGGANVMLTGDPTLSRTHGKLWLEGGAVFYQDLDSANGSWFEDKRVEEKIELAPGMQMRLGKTHMRLKGTVVIPQVEATGETMVSNNMSVSMAGKVDKNSLAEMANQATSVEMLSLTEFVHALLGSAERVPLESTLKRLVEVIPGVWRVSLIAWPPDEHGNFRFLVEPEEGSGAGTISRTLATHAVERREALLFSEDFNFDLKAAQSCIQRGIRSAVYVPLLGPQNEVLGVLCVDSPIPSLPLDTTSFHFLRAVGSLLATALATEKMRDEVRQRELETRQVEARRESLANFLNIASHDLRNPLTVMRGCARVIENSADVPKMQQLSTKIVSASTRAEGLINTYLEVAEITSGQEVSLDLRDLELRSFVDEELEFLHQAIAAKNPELVNEVPDGISVKADPQKLRQILSNLISNGIKYSQGRPRVRVGAQGKGDVVEVFVADNGVGISKEDQQKLFQKFLRVGDRSLAPGTGLGLWLSSALVQTHGGNMWVESEVGHGSAFFFTLAVGVPSAAVAS